MIADDMRWDLLSSRGHQVLNTPNLDALASTGVVMENAFVPVAVCSPSRAAILTGKEPHLASAPRIVWRNNSFLQSQKTVAEHLQDAGYTTAFVGKWHLGEGHLPKRGFDHWESFDWLGEFFDPVIYRDGTPTQYSGYVDDILSRLAGRVMYEHRHENKPLFLVVSLKAPHLKFEHPERHDHAFEDITIAPPDTYHEDFAQSGKLPAIDDWLGINNFKAGLKIFDNSWDRYIKSHYRAILGLDDSIGTIRQTINSGPNADNTLFIYTSDNGYSLGDHGLTEKHMVYEEPVRVPLMIDPPGSVFDGSTYARLTSTTDIAPTILDYAGLPDDDAMTGLSLKSLMTQGDAIEDWRDSVFLTYEKWQIAVRTDEHKLIKSLSVDGHYELYDLVADPTETTTVYGLPEYESVRVDLHRRLKNLVNDNDWSQRNIHGYDRLVVSEPILTSEAASLATELSMTGLTLDESGFATVGGLNWKTIGTEKPGQSGSFLLDAFSEVAENQSVLVYLPLELITERDPFVEVVIRQRALARVYSQGQLNFDNTRTLLPLNAANPLLKRGLNHVVIEVSGKGPMNILLRIEAPDDTIRLALEDRALGDSPGRFKKMNGWQPHANAELAHTANGLSWQSTGEQSVIQTDNIYVDEPVEISLAYTASDVTDVTLQWRSEAGEWTAVNQQSLSLNAGESVATVMIEPSEAIDELRWIQSAQRAENADPLIIKAISITTLSGQVVHNWQF